MDGDFGPAFVTAVCFFCLLPFTVMMPFVDWFFNLVRLPAGSTCTWCPFRAATVLLPAHTAPDAFHPARCHPFPYAYPFRCCTTVSALLLLAAFPTPFAIHVRLPAVLVRYLPALPPSYAVLLGFSVRVPTTPGLPPAVLPTFPDRCARFLLVWVCCAACGSAQTPLPYARNLAVLAYNNAAALCHARQTLLLPYQVLFTL